MTKKPVQRTRKVALCYIRVSTREQVSVGASLDAQRAILTAEAARRGWECRVVSDEGLSGKSLNRPALQEALELLDSGQADYLLALRIDRLSRSVADFAGLLDRAAKRGWGLVMMQPDLDTTSASGKFLAHVLASASEYERRLISDRTREGMAQRRAEGVRMGRPKDMDPDVVARIKREHAAGKSLVAIADGLSAEGIATARGGRRWYPSTIRAVVTAG